MGITTFENKTVEITAVSFRNNPGERRLESFPRRMVWEDREVNFAETGMRYLIHKGQQLVKLFDVSDGQTQYRLRLDGDNHWTLVGMKAGAL